MAKVPVTAKCSSRLTVMEAFQRRHKERLALRERELLLKEKELELQKQNVEFEKEATRKNGKWKKLRENRGWKLN